MINSQDFNLDIFLSPPKATMLPEDLELAVEMCNYTITKRAINGLVANPGSGLRYAFDKFSSKYKNQLFPVECSVQDVATLYGEIMVQLGFGHQLVNWHTAEYPRILKALTYYLKETNYRPLFVFDNCDALRKKSLVELLNTLFELRGLTGAILIFSQKKLDQFLSKPETTSRLLRLDDWLKITDPERGTFRAYCMATGILSQRVIDDLLHDNPDFELLQDKLNKIRAELIHQQSKKKPIK